MPDKLEFLTKLDEDFKFSDGAQTNSGWLHVFTLGTVFDKRYGFFELTPARMARFAANVNEKVLGTDVPIDFSHMDGPDGERAAGWGTKALTTDPAGSGEEGLWLWVDWTPRAANEIRGGEWRYASAMFANVWTDHRGHQIQDVLLGTAVTNHPVLKDLTPINLSDPRFGDELALEFHLHEPTLEHFDLATVDNSAWDGEAAMASCNGAADYRSICAGRREGDPDKAATWALPHHKNPGAPPNRNGVNNALARFDQTQGLVNKDGARRHLEAHQRAIKSMSNLGGEMDAKLLSSIFGLGEDATEEQLVAKATELVSKLTDPDEEKAKTFAEQYPEQAAKLAEQEKALADMREATKLSQINADITRLTTEGPFGIPTKFVDDLRELRKTLTDDADAKLSELLSGIVETGLVELKETGSSRSGHGDNEGQTLAEVMEEIKAEHDDWDARKVLAAALKAHPELADEHVRSAPKGEGGDE